MVPAGAGPLFQRMFTRLGCDGRPAAIPLSEFYPIRAWCWTIRAANARNTFRARPSLICCAEAGRPLACWRGAPALLLSRSLPWRKAAGRSTKPYLDMRVDRTRSRMNRMRRGAACRLRLRVHRGEHYDLEGCLTNSIEIFWRPTATAAHCWSTRSCAPIRLLRSRTKSDCC